jgi:ParB-like chromosome segregation protein Spo0J
MSKTIKQGTGRMSASTAVERAEALGTRETKWVRTDDLSRHPESQIRAESDPRLVAEYAEAMLEGAEFPPVVIFQDAVGKYLADGHHRVDAAALAALKDPRRKAEVLAEIRPGTFEDAVRWAMRANYQHGKRMADADYKRAIEMAIELGFLQSVHAKDVVPEVVELTRCSVRTAQVHTVGMLSDVAADAGGEAEDANAGRRWR